MPAELEGSTESPAALNRLGSATWTNTSTKDTDPAGKWGPHVRTHHHNLCTGTPRVSEQYIKERITEKNDYFQFLRRLQILPQVTLLSKRNKATFIINSFLCNRKKKESFVCLFWTEFLLIGSRVTFEGWILPVSPAWSFSQHITPTPEGHSSTGGQRLLLTSCVTGLEQMLSFTGTDTENDSGSDFSHIRKHAWLLTQAMQTPRKFSLESYLHHLRPCVVFTLYRSGTGGWLAGLSGSGRWCLVGKRVFCQSNVKEVREGISYPVK